jgi:hypothetical protein
MGPGIERDLAGTFPRSVASSLAFTAFARLPNFLPPAVTTLTSRPHGRAKPAANRTPFRSSHAKWIPFVSSHGTAYSSVACALLPSHLRTFARTSQSDMRTSPAARLLWIQLPIPCPCTQCTDSTNARIQPIYRATDQHHRFNA